MNETLNQLIDFLVRNGPEELEKKYAISFKQHQKYDNLYLFKYNQIASDFKEPIVRLCRGIILDKNNGWLPVCFPYVKFFNYGEPLAAQIDWSSAKIYEKADGCFLSNTSLPLWGGGSIHIGKVVNKKLNVQLIGMDKNGNIVPCGVIDWKKNGKKNNWIDIILNKYIKSLDGKQYGKKIRVTDNHNIFVNGKFIQAKDIKIGDKLTKYNIKPSSSIIHLIESSLLGDGCITADFKKFRYHESHTEKQKEYVDYLNKLLAICAIKTRNTTSGHGSNMFWCSSKSYDCLGELRKKWYPKGKKTIPKDLSWMDDFSVAKWYMDDGSLCHNTKQKDRAAFATNGFSEKDVLRLSKKIEQMYNVPTHVSYSKGWCLKINAGKNNEIDNFWEKISPYIVDCLKYKLPEKYRNTNFVCYPIGDEEIIKEDIIVKKIKKVENIKKNFPSGRVGYDIETTTNNYFCKGVLVHNSLIKMYWYDNHWEIATSGTPDADCQVNNGKMTFKDLFWQTWNELGYKLPIDKGFTYMMELCCKENRIVVQHKKNNIIFHGARNMIPYKDFELKYEEFDPMCIVSYHYLNWEIIKSYEFTSIDEILEYNKSLNGLEQEGFVVCDKDFNRVKIKCEDYVRLHYCTSNMSTRRMLEIVQKNESEEFLVAFPEWKQLYENIKLQYNGLISLDKQDYIKYNNPNMTQKEFAMQVKDLKNSGALFAMHNGKIKSFEEYYSNMLVKKLEERLNLDCISLSAGEQ